MPCPSNISWTFMDQKNGMGSLDNKHKNKCVINMEDTLFVLDGRFRDGIALV